MRWPWKAAAWLVWLAPLALAGGCDSIECMDIRQAICEKACACDFCQIQPGGFVLVDAEDCNNALTEKVCTEDTDTEALEACQSAIDSSTSQCPYIVPDACNADALKPQS